MQKILKIFSDIAKAKSEIINNIKNNGYIILNADDKFFLFSQKNSIKRKLNIISFGILINQI